MAISPSGYYQSIYSGEEIDNAIGEIPGIQTALSNKAPGGFGFGEKLVEIQAESADESYETYCAKIDAFAADMPNNTAAFVRAYPPAIYGMGASTVSVLYKNTNDYLVLRCLSWADPRGYGWQMIRARYPSSQSPSVWLPFEWSNPPLQIGVEYRTTERYLGKPIYVKLVNFGALPNTSYKLVNVAKNSQVIRVSGLVSNNRTIPGAFGTENNRLVIANGDSSNIMIKTYADESASAANVTAWYIKSTDD